MWPRRAPALAVLLSLLCGLDDVVEADEKSQVSGRTLEERGLRRVARAGGPLRTEIVSPKDFFEHYDDSYLENDHDDDYQKKVQRTFTGNAHRELDERPHGHSSGRQFAADDRQYDSISEGAGFGAYNKPYDFNSNDGRGSEYDGDVGPTAARREPSHLHGYRDGANNAGLGRSKETDGQRWLKILAEFLKTSKEGRELLRAQTGALQVGGDGALPLPVLLVPVHTGDQCSAIKTSPGRELEPPSDYLPPHGGAGQDRPVTPTGPSRPVEDKDRIALLVRLFRGERPRAPLLPPVLLPASPRPVPRAPLPPLSPAAPPDRHRFSRSLLIRAELTVYYADFTEPYTVWYDATSGSSRVDMHGGTTVLYRTVMPNNEVQRVQVRMERHTETERRRCARLTSAASAADRAPPGLPDPEPFRFHGYKETAEGRLERWVYSLAGQAGELGAARGEALTFHHELLVARVSPDFVLPYKYLVSVDSSLLGADVDRYEHRYLEAREQQPAARYMRVDVERECDVSARAPRLDLVDPLRAFVLTHRDTRCDTDFDKFKETFDVVYESDHEEAIRKTLLIRSTQFVESANRQGGPALLAVNELSVLLKAEKDLFIKGLVQKGEPLDKYDPESGQQPFPYTKEEVKEIAAQLPAAFSWKRKGAVTHVRNQGACNSCWAFAVVASVEGALFLRSGRLVPLSEQQLLDCTPGACPRGKHVQHPYRRVRDHGLAPLDNYTRYDYRSPHVNCSSLFLPKSS